MPKEESKVPYQVAQLIERIRELKYSEMERFAHLIAHNLAAADTNYEDIGADEVVNTVMAIFSALEGLECCFADGSLPI